MRKNCLNIKYCSYLLFVVCVLSSFTWGDFLEWAPTPPMGWNSWDCFGCSVTEEEVKANADYMAKHLKQYGWEHIVVDIQWYEPKSDKHSSNPYAYPSKLDTNIDQYGRVWPVANKHPSSVDGKGFKPLADYVHALGLKFGIHMMRGIPKLAYERNTPIMGTSYTARDIADTGSTCEWNPDMYGVDTSRPGAQEYYNSIMNLVASWGVDYVKIDDLSRPYHREEIETIRKAIDQCGRPIVLSTSPGATPLSAGEHVSQHANLWRISDDFWDSWDHLKDQFQRLYGWSKWCNDGYYPDADMLPLGNIRARSNGWTNFTETEQKTMMTMWAIARSPLMMGGHMPNNDEYTLSLLTNPEILYVNQYSINNRQLFRNDDLIAWMAEDRNSDDVFIALINGQDNTYDSDKASWVSPVISRDSEEKSVPFEVSLVGVKQLYLVVDDAGDGSSCDHADWLNMLLMNKNGVKIPLTYLKWTEATSGWGNVNISASVSGNGFSVDGISYHNGLGTHSNSIIQYELPEGKYIKLEGIAALDDGGANQRSEGATMQFQVYTVDPKTTSKFSAVDVELSDLGVDGKCEIRDLWSHEKLGEFEGTFKADIKAHGAGLYRVKEKSMLDDLADDASNNEYSAYLFAYFTGNGPGQEQIRFAVSEDGFNYKALNNNKPIMYSKDISASGGVRDPHILRAEDGETFYMVATDLYVPKMGWSNYAMIMMKSKDLIHWDSSVVNVPQSYPEQFGKVHRVWAPQTIYDKNTGKYMVYFSMKEGDSPDVIYYAYANKDFTGFESAPEQLYFPPADSNTRACIDGDIIYKDGKYYLFHKAEDGDPGIKLAISDKLTEGYKLYRDRRMDLSRDPVEGSGIFRLNEGDDWILMYDVYTKGRYQFTRSSDLLNFEVIDNEITMDFHPRHGTVMPITNTELLRLVGKWGSLEHFLLEIASNCVKTRNVAINDEKAVIRLPVRRGTDLKELDPEFKVIAGVNIEPKGAQDFSKGPVDYAITISGQEPVVLKVTATEDYNPVLDGYYADPDIIYAEKTGKFYIYPTSDGYTGWSGTYFKTFSSDNLVDWKDEGIILDLKTDVDWTDRNAWAPCIIEKKIDGQYKYLYYFTAAQKIGVAVSDSPTGPFIDSGKPLVDSYPPGLNHGQQIDPDVFCDPETGKNYLYWGNGYMAVAELNEDMISIKQDSVMVITPDRTYREGTHVFYRKGKYYFLWSEDDTRSENYRVRYATASSPTGPLNIPEDNLVIAKNPEVGIYATGHNSTIQIPGKDEWYIVYHRFTYPKGIEMGRSAGYHRETCIDKMEFDEFGNIIQVRPTHKGITLLEK